MDDPVMEKMLRSGIGRPQSLSDEEILSAWRYITVRAETVLNLEIVGSKNVIELRYIILQLIAKEFPGNL